MSLEALSFSSDKGLLNNDNAKAIKELVIRGNSENLPKALQDHLDHTLYRLPSANDKELNAQASLDPSSRAELLNKLSGLVGMSTELGTVVASTGKTDASDQAITYRISSASNSSKAKDISDYDKAGTFALGIRQ